MRIVWLAVSLWSLSITGAIGQTPGERLPVPGEDEIRKEVRLVQQAFEEEYREASNGSASRLIQTLSAAAKIAKSPVRRYALLDEAERAAGDAGDVAAAMDLVQAKARAFQLDVVRSQVERLSEVHTRNPAIGAAVVPHALRLAEEALQAEDLLVAEAAVTLAQAAIGQEGRQGEDGKQLASLSQLIAATGFLVSTVGAAREQLQADGEDPAANGTVGLFEVLLRGDLAAGLPRIAASNLGQLRMAAIAQLKLAEEDDPSAEAVFATATQWWDAADEIVGIAPLVRRHAAHLYSGVATNLSDAVDTALATKRAAGVRAPTPSGDLGDQAEGDGLDGIPDSSSFKGAAAVYRARIDAASRRKAVRAGGGNIATESAVDKALDWLAAHQMDDGGWSLQLTSCPRCAGRCSHGGRVRGDRSAATALALLPFLARGDTHKSGRHSKLIKAGLVFLGKRVKAGDGCAYDDDGTLYSQGLASLALTEAFLLTRDLDIKSQAQRAIGFVQSAQDPVGGGWRYGPKQPGDTSVTGWQVAALATARAARLQVAPVVFAKATSFLDSVQSDDGHGYGYVDRSNPTPARNAIGLLCRLELGADYKTDLQRQALRKVAANGPSRDLYHDFFATQLLYRTKATEWKTWNEVMTTMLVRSQATAGHEKGSWYDGVEGGHGAVSAGRLYTTSLATLILQVYYRAVPLE